MSEAAKENEQNQSSGSSSGGLVQVPRAVDLWPPVAVDEGVGDVDEGGVLDDRGSVQHAPHGRPVLVAAATKRSAVARSAMSPHSTTTSAPRGSDRLDGREHLVVRLRAGSEHDPATDRRRQLLGEEQSEAAQTAGDEVGAVGPERRGRVPAVPPPGGSVRGTSSTSLPVCRRRSSPEWRWPPRSVDSACSAATAAHHRRSAGRRCSAGREPVGMTL